MASAPRSNGVIRAYGKAVQIAQPLEAVCEEYDIKEDFDNKHGAPITNPATLIPQSGGCIYWLFTSICCLTITLL